MSGIGKPEFTREPAHQVQFACRLGEEMMWYTRLMRTTTAQKWPAIDDKLPPAHCSQVARAKASTSSTAYKNSIELPLVIAVYIDDGIATLHVLFDQTNPLSVRRLGKSDIHKNLLVLDGCLHLEIKLSCQIS